jgi:hypothetical protein
MTHIIMQGFSVRAILDGRKMVTRRVIKWPLRSQSDGNKRRIFTPKEVVKINEYLSEPQRCPLYRIMPYHPPGSRLAVKEAWRVSVDWDAAKPSELPDHAEIEYLSDETMRFVGRYRHAQFMPDRFVRMFLTVVDVRVERLQEITEQSAMDEGYYQAVRENTKGSLDPVEWYKSLWSSIHGPGSWDANPFVWRIAFKREGT